MKKLPLVLALGLAIQGTALAVPTVSTPVPKAALQVQQTLETQIQNLQAVLASNINALEQATNMADACNAELPGNQPPRPDHSSRYLDCRQAALTQVKEAFQRIANVMESFGNSTGSVREQLNQSMKSNQGFIAQYEREARKTVLTLKRTKERAIQLANSLPEEGNPSREQMREMRKLLSEIQFAEANQHLIENALATLKKNEMHLADFGQVIDGWQDAIEGEAYTLHLKADLYDRKIAAGAAVGQAQVLIAQFRGADISGIASLIQQIHQFDYGRFEGHGVLPIDDRSYQKPSLLSDDQALIDYFKSLRSH